MYQARRSSRGLRRAPTTITAHTANESSEEQTTAGTLYGSIDQPAVTTVPPTSQASHHGGRRRPVTSGQFGMCPAKLSATLKCVRPMPILHRVSVPRTARMAARGCLALFLAALAVFLVWP